MYDLFIVDGFIVPFLVLLSILGVVTKTIIKKDNRASLVFWIPMFIFILLATIWLLMWRSY